MAVEAERYDIVLLGATGFTGIHCIPYLQKLSKENGRNLSWAISGRSEEKLKDALAQMGNKIGVDLSAVPIIISDIKNDESLANMAKQGRIVINCCGPYRFLGEPVVKACIEAGTHYVDVSGEPQFLENIQLKYHKAAQEKGVYLVSACGLDSIPCDLGLIFLQDKFDGTLNSVVTYLYTSEEGEGLPGPAVNYGTWESLVYGLAHATELSQIRRQLFPKRLPSFKPSLQTKTLPHRPGVVDGWALPFPGADRSVMKRTQRYMYEEENKRPVQVDTQVTFSSFIAVIFIVISFLIWTLLVKFKWGRSLLLNYPHLFTFGMFRKDQNPSEEKINNTIFQITFYGEGWREKLPDKNDQYSNPPNKSIIARVKGRNPGYGATCACLVGAAIILISEKEKLPQGGGVFTPGSAFEKTSLINLLCENGITFDIISEKDI
ncbi:unnamed protein product [Phyllotreta striolata]|uniref:Saccharopine dehydrogenase NADP binding domain-containing protein n=1 Tax=Phyllotreta striolata TaxID=444603 RepID=A0A9N9TQ39_PHYSR|nr:unnamed protein product [Phyllotreta striolata]